MLEQKEYKNYKELCEEIGWEISGGNKRKKQMEYLKTICDYHKEGNKIVIDKIFGDFPVEIPDGRTFNGKEPKYLQYTLPMLISILRKDTSVIPTTEDDKQELVCYKSNLSDSVIFDSFFDINNPNYKVISEDYLAIGVGIEYLKRWSKEVLYELYKTEYNIVHNSTLNLLANKHHNSISRLIRCIGAITEVNEDEYKCNEQIVEDLDIYQKVKTLESIWRESHGNKKSNMLLSDKERKQLKRDVGDELSKLLGYDITSYQKVNSIEIYVSDKKLIKDIEKIRKEFRILVFDDFYNRYIEKIKTPSITSKDSVRFEKIYKIDLFNSIISSGRNYPKEATGKKEYSFLKSEIKRLKTVINSKDKEIEQLKDKIKELEDIIVSKE